jgi:hypothetical protein
MRDLMVEHPAMAWLEAELARVEQLARDAGGNAGRWVINPRYSDPRFVNGEPPAPNDCMIDNLGTGPVVYIEVGDVVSKKQRLAEAMLIQANNPAAVVRRVAADRRILADLLAEPHQVVGDCWYTCAAATEDRDGGTTCRDDMEGEPCDCGRDARVERQVLLLAEGYGWKEREAGRPSP